MCILRVRYVLVYRFFFLLALFFHLCIFRSVAGCRNVWFLTHSIGDFLCACHEFFSLLSVHISVRCLPVLTFVFSKKVQNHNKINEKKCEGAAWFAMMIKIEQKCPAKLFLSIWTSLSWVSFSYVCVSTRRDFQTLEKDMAAKHGFMAFSLSVSK